MRTPAGPVTTSGSTADCAAAARRVQPRVQPPSPRPSGLRADSASFLSERQCIVSFSAVQAESASQRSVSAHTASHDPPVTLPPLHLASGVELLAGDAKPP